MLEHMFMYCIDITIFIVSDTNNDENFQLKQSILFSSLLSSIILAFIAYGLLTTSATNISMFLFVDLFFADFIYFSFSSPL